MRVGVCARSSGSGVLSDSHPLIDAILRLANSDELSLTFAPG